MLVDIAGLAERFNMHYQSYVETIQLILGVTDKWNYDVEYKNKCC